MGEIESDMVWECAPAGASAPDGSAGEGSLSAGHEAGRDSGRDARLAGAARQGDLAAFNRLVLIHQDRLYWWIVSLVRDETLAEDLTQAAFISAYENLSNFRGGSFRAWLFTIARNRSYDELRRRQRYPQLSLDELTEEGPENPADIPLPDPLPEDALLRAEQARLVERLLERLSDNYRQVIRLVDMEDLDYQDAANILCLPLGTVKSRLARARQILRGWVSQSMLNN